MLATIILAGVAGLLIALLAGWLAAERGRLLLPSTRQFLKEAGFGLNALHGYIYGRWTRQYISFLLNSVSPRPGADK